MDQKTDCELCGGDWIYYDDHVEYGDGPNNESRVVSMCSNEECDNCR